MKYHYLDKINFPSDLRKFKKNELNNIAEELRFKTIEAVSKTGGHLGAGLGVIELTIALHYIFNTPRDRLIWDVGHQAYPHKMLTGRKNKIDTLRQKDGLYGFVRRSESEYDPFGTAHSSTSVSAGLGIKIAKDLSKDNANVLCVIGDGALSAGLAYEALNNVGAMNKRLIVILNDNEMSIDQPVGAMSSYLTKLLSSRSYSNIRSIIKKLSKNLPENIKNNNIDKPIFLHCITKKGKGYEPAEKSIDKFHGVNKFNIQTGQSLAVSNQKTYSQIFGETLSKLAEEDEKIIAVTAAMVSGTGLDIFGKNHPARLFDVGIAEQHAVTMCAGLATEGYKPFVAIYSTFLQRAYDQVIHDVALQKLPVRFAIDRAGQVGADGPTHAGSFDIAYLSAVPNFIIMVPSNQNELIKMINTSLLINDFPSAFRYPRGIGILNEDENNNIAIEIGKGYIVREGNEVAILNLGTRLESCFEALKILEHNNIYPTLADARFAKPLDLKLIDTLLDNHKYILTIEEGSIGGFGSSMLHYIHNVRIRPTNAITKNLIFPDRFIEHNKPDAQYKEIGMDSESIAKQIVNFFDEKIINLKNFTKTYKS